MGAYVFTCVRVLLGTIGAHTPSVRRTGYICHVRRRVVADVMGSVLIEA